MTGQRVLLIISGGIAAYKALELIRLLRRQGCGVTCVLTGNAGQFVTPLSLQALSESKVAATVAEPLETAVSNPELETPATDAGVELQVAAAVTSLVVLSLYVTMALS